jgi:ureidoglycolate lyase
MTAEPFLVTVAPDAGGRPGPVRAFLAAPGQAVNLLRNTWHGVLTPLGPTGLFAVIDRIGAGANLQEYRFAEPPSIVAGVPPVASPFR